MIRGANSAAHASYYVVQVLLLPPHAARRMLPSTGTSSESICISRGTSYSSCKAVNVAIGGYSSESWLKSWQGC